MLRSTAYTVGTSPLTAAAVQTSQCNQRLKPMGLGPAGLQRQFLPSDARSMKLAGFVRQLYPTGNRRGLCDNRKQSASIVCAAALDARCSASGQTQTVLREAPTITKVPVRDTTKSPELDDGGTGFPPGGGDGGGGGGGGGGGNWSGGFFLFGFLAFLGFLKDKEGEEDYRVTSRGR